MNIKSHTHVKKVGTYLGISVWHLLMNLKSNYLLKKLLKWANKNVRILIFTILYLKKKKERNKNTRRFHYFTRVCQKSY